jgi:hypothetical protein
VEEDEPKSGYRRPPMSTRFKKGQSGNLRGRPKGRRHLLPYETVLGQRVRIREDGKERTVTAEEAFLIHLAKRGIEGDSASARAAMLALEEARASRFGSNHIRPVDINIVLVAVGNVNGPLRSLKMATKLDPYRDTARMAIEPWIVQKALERLGDKRLTEDEQRTIVQATRTPRKVKWPDWWTVLP